VKGAFDAGIVAGCVKGKEEMKCLDLLPNFENFTYRIAVIPPLMKVTAWGKLQECERRLAMYEWVETLNDPRDPQNRVLLDDSVSAFLMTFEATLQFLKNQFRVCGKANFDKWLVGRSEHDVTVCGLRTLRHSEAHVEPKALLGQINVMIGESLQDNTSMGATSWAWRLPTLSSIDLRKVRSPLKEVELSDWNRKVSNWAVGEVFKQGLIGLKKILEAAESEL
jgi:hypothetical protein